MEVCIIIGCKLLPMLPELFITQVCRLWVTQQRIFNLVVDVHMSTRRMYIWNDKRNLLSLATNKYTM